MNTGERHYLLNVFSICFHQGVIGSNPITCLTFDKRAYGSFQATNWVYVNVRGVSADSDGVDGKAGLFVSPSRVKIPYFERNDFFQLTVSLWFKKRSDLSGACMILLSTGQCELRYVLCVFDGQGRYWSEDSAGHFMLFHDYNLAHMDRSSVCSYVCACVCACVRACVRASERVLACALRWWGIQICPRVCTAGKKTNTHYWGLP